MSPPPLGWMLTAWRRPFEFSDTWAEKAGPTTEPSNWPPSIATGQLAGNVAGLLAPGALNGLSGSLDIALDVDAVAGAGADDGLRHGLAPFRLVVVRPAADALAIAVRADDLTAAGPVADEGFEWTFLRGASARPCGCGRRPGRRARSEACQIRGTGAEMNRARDMRGSFCSGLSRAATQAAMDGGHRWRRRRRTVMTGLRIKQIAGERGQHGERR